MKHRWIVVPLFTAVATASLSVPSVHATPAAGSSSTILAKALFEAMNVHLHTDPADRWAADLQTRGDTDLYVVDVKLAPGGTTGWHSHPGPSLVLVASGTVTNYSTDAPGCAGQTYSAGQGFIDPGGSSIHMVRNTGSVQAETVAVQFLPSGSTRRIDESVPAQCAG